MKKLISFKHHPQKNGSTAREHEAGNLTSQQQISGIYDIQWHLLT